MNHFANVCLRRSDVNEIKYTQEVSAEGNYYIDSITLIDSNYEILPKDNVNETSNICVNYNSSSSWNKIFNESGNNISFKIDTGSQVNIMPYNIYNQLRPLPSLLNTSLTLSAYNNTNIPVRGKCICIVNHNKMEVPVTFVITSDFTPILGLPTAEKLGLIKLVSTISISDKIVSDYADCFGDIGCLPNEYHMEVDPSVSPVISPSRKIPHSMRFYSMVEGGARQNDEVKHYRRSP